jgi:hypothetical protein
VAYFPGDIDRSFWEVLDPDQGRILANTVRWALNEPEIVTVNGPGVLDVSVWEQDGSMTVHLVNLTNPMMMKGPIRELYPIGPLEVGLKLPDGRRAKEIRLLAAKSTPKTAITDSVLTVTVPKITDHEVIAVSI